MTLLERLQSHKGSLIKLKTELFWYGGRGWDENPGRVCLLLDAAAIEIAYGSTVLQAHTGATHTGMPGTGMPATAQLLIDGSPHWVWVAEEDVALL